MVTTSCRTGKACYFNEKNDPKRIIDIVKASSSLPYVCPISYVDGEPMVDGGVADSIPICRAIDKGFDKNVVVLTRNKGYRKPMKEDRVPFFFYRKYPQLRRAIATRNLVYNSQLDLVEKLEEEGKVLVIRPIESVKVSRIEKDTKKLLELYNEGYRIADAIKF
jgi:predicted patatin/cPLA2 family phospholipase